MTKRYTVILTNDLKPLSSAAFKIQAEDDTYSKMFEGIPLSSEAAARAMLMRDGVTVTHADESSWDDTFGEWHDSVINAALRSLQ